MIYIAAFIVYYLLIFTLYFLVVLLPKKKAEKYKKGRQVQLFVKKFELDFNKISIRKFLLIIACTNSFVMALTLTIITLVKNFLLKMLLAFGILVGLLLICYYLIGMYITKVNKKEGNKNV